MPRVRVESIEGDVFHVVVLAASGGRVGKQLTYPRAALYATQGDEYRGGGLGRRRRSSSTS